MVKQTGHKPIAHVDGPDDRLLGFRAVGAVARPSDLLGDPFLNGEDEMIGDRQRRYFGLDTVRVVHWS